jgi:CheY-like chemotaxis protein
MVKPFGIFAKESEVNLKGKHIFIIEDNNYNLSVAMTILEKAGAEIQFDRWGVDTLPRLRKFAPVDIILLDLMFPKGVTGYDIYDQIRLDPAFDSVPVVAVSAADPNDAVPKLRQKGFAGFIRKPINFMQFPHQLITVLEGETVWAW